MELEDRRTWCARRYHDARLSRRSLLNYAALGGASLAATGLLAACGDDDEDGESELPAPTRTVAATEPAGSADATPTAGGDAATPTTGQQPAEPTATTAAEPSGDEPQVGGTLIIAVTSADTLDTHLTGDGNAMAMAWLMGSTMLAKDHEGEYHPWLATDWEMSEDGLTWEFTLRDDVAFHDGTPLTATEYAWTITRLLAPETAAPQAGRLRAVATAEAVDDYTLRLILGSPYPILLEQLSNTGVTQPYLPSFVEEAGDQFGQVFMGVGPYKLVEWRTGDGVTLERNPDFNWGPPFVENQGAYYIETIEFRIVPERSTIVAALEAGDAHYAIVTGDDIDRLEDAGNIDIYESLTQGMNPAIHMNNSVAPFDDIRVRKAFNLAVDRENLIQIAAGGHAEPQYGPLSPTIRDYTAEVEEIGYGFDLDQARALLEEAGFSPGDDDIMERNGEALRFTFKADPTNTKLAEVLQAQYQALGVALEIEVVEAAIFTQQLLGGEFDIILAGYLASESDILYRWFHTSREGALNVAKSSDPELDRLLDLTRSTLDLEERAVAVADVQKYMVEQAIVVPLYSPKEFTALSTQVEGELFSPPSLSATLKVFLNDAYIVED